MKVAIQRHPIGRKLKAVNDIYRPTKSLKLYKKMKEERNITLTLDKAKEWYKKGGELQEIALQAFTEKELNPLPKSWEEYCKQGNSIDSLRYNIPTKYEALFKLEQLRNCWWGEWRPKWDNSAKYCICVVQGIIRVRESTVPRFLIFPTKQMMEEFLKCFKSLIVQAEDLL